MRKSSSSRSAFTLVELIIVVIILGVLMAVAIPVFFGMSNGAKDNVARQYLTVSYHAVKSTTARADGAWPGAASAASAIVSSEPEYTATIGDCITAATKSPASSLTVDAASAGGVNGSVLAYSHSASGKLFRLYASAATGPVIGEAGCGISSSGQRMGTSQGLVTSPTIAGTYQPGNTITVNPGAWTDANGNPVTPTVGYQWITCDASWQNCTPIVGQNSPSYTLTSGDVGNGIGAIEIVTDPATGIKTPIVVSPGGVAPGGGGGGASAPCGGACSTNGTLNPLPPTNSGGANAPVISGLPAAAGVQLSGSNGTWVSTVSNTYTYAWYRCSDATCTSPQIIGGANASTYTPNAGADGGNYLRFAVTASNAGGSNTANSAITNQVQIAPTYTGAAPTINAAGSQVSVGQTITATSPGSFTNGYAAPAYTYIWQWTDGTIRQSNSSNTYVTTSGDGGQYMQVKVTNTNAAGAATSAASTATGIVGSAPTGVSTGGSSVAETDAGINGSYSTNGGLPITGEYFTGNFGTIGASGGNAHIYGLNRGTGYNYQYCVSNSIGTSCGSVQSFTTYNYGNVSVGASYGGSFNVNFSGGSPGQNVDCNNGLGDAWSFWSDGGGGSGSGNWSRPQHGTVTCTMSDGAWGNAGF